MNPAQIHIEFYQAAMLVALLIGSYWVLVKVIVGQFERRLDERFATAEGARKEASVKWDVRHNKIEDDVADLSKRVIRIEAEFKHAPTQEQIAEINEGLAEVRGQNQTQTELLERVERQQNMITDWMMENK